MDKKNGVNSLPVVLGVANTIFYVQKRMQEHTTLKCNVYKPYSDDRSLDDTTNFIVERAVNIKVK